MPDSRTSSPPGVRSSASAVEVFTTFLWLGLTSFGGPIAHLGYFHREFVVRRRWIDDAQFAQLLALCQFLPGPASSQLGFAVGLIRAGWLGALAAFTAFTLPSAALLVAFAGAADRFAGAQNQAVIHGLKLIAVAVVADGLRRMAQQLTPDLRRIAIAICSATIILISNSPLTQLAVVCVGALLGLWLCRRVVAMEGGEFALRFGWRAGSILVAVFTALLACALIIEQTDAASLVGIASGFYRAGALVFGGGHVVLPLLQQTVVDSGAISTDDFLAGYGAAQAVPGPMFTLAAFLGARLEGIPMLLGASIALLAIFVPGLLLVSGALPFWSRVGRHAGATRALAGVNAAVVGLLAAAFYDPVWKSSIVAPADFVIATVGFVLLAVTRTPTLLVVAWCVGASVLWSALGPT